MVDRYDVIVIGLGGMGSASAYHLARRGKRVLGLEQYEPLHPLGSSHGLTRIIRLAYHEHPSYVPLLHRAYELWHELQALARRELLIITGSLEGGPEDGPMFRGALEAAELHDLEHEVLDVRALTSRYPVYTDLDPSTKVVWQPQGGFLLSEETMQAHHDAARQAGAELRFGRAVMGWEPMGDGVRVRTSDGNHEADRLVICAGPWARRLLTDLERLAVPERQVLAWFTPKRQPEAFSVDAFPVFVLDVEEGSYYGFPTHEGHGLKLGWYHHFREPIDPDDPDRSTRPDDEAVLRRFVERYLPDAAGPTEMLKSCIFTNSPDEHFIIDVLPDAPQVAIAAGFSGHGYKFCSVVGEIMADLALEGSTRHDIGLFELARFSNR